MKSMAKVLAVVAVLGLVAPAFAAKGDKKPGDKPKKGEKPLTGKVVSVTAPEAAKDGTPAKDGKLVLAAREGGQKVEKEIVISTSTKLMVNNEETTEWTKVETGMMAKVVPATGTAATVQVMKVEKKPRDPNKPKKNK